MELTTSLFAGRKRAHWIALALLACAGAHTCARAQTMYKCVDDKGRVEYTDVGKRGCKVLEVPGAIPAPPQHRPSAARSGGSAPAVAPATPTDFPRVDGAQQRARDDDRRGILAEELQTEEKKLADLRRDFNGGEPERNGNEKNYAKYQERVAQMRDDIARAERNVAALKRELANIK